MRRRIFIILGCLLAAGAFALATLPWWIGPVAKNLARRYGVEIGRYERLGYSRFAVYDVVVTQPPVKVTVARAETQTPLLWLFHHAFGEPAAVTAGDWRVDVLPASTLASAPAAASPDSGAMRLRRTLFKIADSLDRWLPSATIGAGMVTWKGGELGIGAAEWKNRSLTVRPLRFRTQAADVLATFAKNDELLLTAESKAGLAWRASLKSVGDEITGELHMWDQPASLVAKLPAQGWMPAELLVRAEQWAVPGTELKLGEAYATVRGDARLEWREGNFEASANAAGEALEGKNAPPLVAKLHAKGDRQSVTVDSLAVDLPGVTATLDAGVTFSRRLDTPAAPSEFTLEMDLAKQPWIPSAKGLVSGRARVAPLAGEIPHIDASINASGVAIGDWAIARFTASTTFDWPRIQVANAVLGFAEGGQLVLSGGWDFSTHAFTDVVAQGEVRPSVVRPWLPAGVNFESLALAAKAHGPVDALEHQGNAQLKGLLVPPLKTIAADLVWTGVGAGAEISEAHLIAGKSRLSLAGKIDAKSVSVSAFKWEQDGAERLNLAQPTVVHWTPALEVGPLQLRGGEAVVEVSATLGQSGRVAALVRNFPSVWLADFAEVPGPEWRLTSFDGQGTWDRGPASFNLSGQLAVTLAPGRIADVAIAARNDSGGVKIESLRVFEAESPIVNASGRLPVAFFPGTANFIRFESGAALALQATTASNPVFWKKLTEATGLEFEDPEIDLNLSGTWESPHGEVMARATRLAVDPQRIKFPFPTVEALDVHALADGDGIKVDRFAVKVQGQSVRGSGSLPLTPKQWPEFNRAPLEYLRKEGSLRLEIPDAEVSAFSRYVGEYLAPVGRLQVDVTLSRGGEMAGSLSLKNAATRPLGPLGVLQEVQAEARLAGNSIEVKNVTARAGGQPVTLTGRVELPVDGPPKFDLALVAENFPLVRQTGLLMRADLNLKLVTKSDSLTEVTGEVNLRDSMFLSDVRALIPKGGGGGPSRRPPFFSIEVAPLNAWKLSVDVRGDEFLRLRSAVFVGVASARFHLGGTLGEPRAIGEATVDSGQVLLPFATFRVEQGTVRLTEADPYSLQLYLAGTSRRYGYDLRMDVTGTAADPIVTFSSSPPLEAKEVLLMVTAGEVPNDTITYGSAQRVAKLGTYLGQSLINNFGGESTDADRLSISTGERVSRQGRETYNIEYQVNDRLSAVGEYDEFDAYNFGLKWRFFAQKPPEKSDAAEARPEKKKEDANVAR